MNDSTAENVVIVKELTKFYPGSDTPAVNGLSLSIEKGTVFGLLGPNGAGKTTTISILCTLLLPSSGQASVLGFDVVRNSREVRGAIGLVPQEIALYSSLTARENLRFFARILRIKGRNIEKRVAECLDIVGLTDHADQTISTFSGGMKRRANLAAGILHDPQLLFLDEPTVGIDAQSRHLILNRLADLNRAGVTIVYTSHYMEEVQQICDRVAIIDAGRVVSTGHPDTLVKESPGCRNLEELYLSLTGKQLRD